MVASYGSIDGWLDGRLDECGHARLMQLWLDDWLVRWILDGWMTVYAVGSMDALLVGSVDASMVGLMVCSIDSSMQ